jgi:multiple sugar transport system substrate-binding protein
VAIIPHAEGQKPVTVLFGANICMFKSTPERQKAAWEFIKYFCSPEVTALWATKTGYLPVRSSATETDVMKAFFEAKPQNRRAIDALPFARPEPNVAGIQTVRTLVDKAESDVVYRVKTPEEAAKALAAGAEKALRESQ